MQLVIKGQGQLSVLNFGHLVFGFVSDFEIRISDFYSRIGKLHKTRSIYPRKV